LKSAREAAGPNGPTPEQVVQLQQMLDRLRKSFESRSGPGGHSSTEREVAEKLFKRLEGQLQQLVAATDSQRSVPAPGGRRRQPANDGNTPQKPDPEDPPFKPNAIARNVFGTARNR
jgi:hypothetical protein